MDCDAFPSEKEPSGVAWYNGALITCGLDGYTKCWLVNTTGFPPLPMDIEASERNKGKEKVKEGEEDTNVHVELNSEELALRNWREENKDLPPWLRFQKRFSRGEPAYGIALSPNLLLVAAATQYASLSRHHFTHT